MARMSRFSKTRLSRSLRQIEDLEKELGFALFDRLPRGVRLSAAGKLYLSDGRKAIHRPCCATKKVKRMDVIVIRQRPVAANFWKGCFWGYR
jgi:hypothetical protein